MNLFSPHTPAHTPEFVSGKNPWLMTPRPAHCSSSYDSYVYPNLMRPNAALQMPPTLQYPSIIHPSPICQISQPNYPSEPVPTHKTRVDQSHLVSCDSLNSNLFVRSAAPPGFPQIKVDHDYRIQDKPSYATNLFNQPVDRRHMEPNNDKNCNEFFV